jgi:hypothetical protein
MTGEALCLVVVVGKPHITKRSRFMSDLIVVAGVALGACCRCYACGDLGVTVSDFSMAVNTFFM